MGANSREKGKYGEIEVRDLFRDLFDGMLEDVSVIRRNHQQAEIGGADLVNVPLFSVEVKRVKKLPWGKEMAVWWKQTVAQAADNAEQEGMIPCLVMRQDFGKWMVMVYVHVEVEEGREEVSPCVGILPWREFERYVKDLLTDT